MTLPTTSMLSSVILQIENAAGSAKVQAQGAALKLQSGNVDSIWVMNFLDQIRAIIDQIDKAAAVPGLAAYASANIPNYSGDLVADLNTTRTAAAACITWIVNNFPKDSASGYSLALIINADGSRTSRQFTPAQTVGLQTALNNFIATIG